MRLRSRIRALWDGSPNGPHCLPVPGAPGVTVNVIRQDWEPVGLCPGEENHTTAARYYLVLAHTYPGLAFDVCHVRNLIGDEGWVKIGDPGDSFAEMKALHNGGWMFRVR